MHPMASRRARVCSSIVAANAGRMNAEAASMKYENNARMVYLFHCFVPRSELAR